MVQRANSDPDPCYCQNLRQAAQSITRIYDRALATSGLSGGQYLLLSQIAYCEPISVSDLAKRVNLERTTVVRNLKPIEKQGWIRDSAPMGGRRRQLRLTELGQETLAMGNKLWQRVQAKMLAQIGQDDLQALERIMAKLRQ